MISTVSVDVSGPHSQSIAITRTTLQSSLLTLYSSFTADEQKKSDDGVIRRCGYEKMESSLTRQRCF